MRFFARPREPENAPGSAPGHNGWEETMRRILKWAAAFAVIAVVLFVGWPEPGIYIGERTGRLRDTASNNAQETDILLCRYLSLTGIEELQAWLAHAEYDTNFETARGQSPDPAVCPKPVLWIDSRN